MIKYEFKSSDGGDVGSLISKILADNANARSKAGSKTVDVFNKIVRRSMGRTGSNLLKYLKTKFRMEIWNFPKRRIYTKTGVAISEVIKRNPPNRAGERLRTATQNPPIGSAFGKMMRYKMNDESIDDMSLEVGMIPGKKVSESWANIFSQWQEKSTIKYQTQNNRSVRYYFRAIGIPLAAGTILTRPARPAIEEFRKENDPISEFQKNFLERLLK